MEKTDQLIKFVGIATFAALAYIFIAPKLFKNPPFDIPGLVGDVPDATASAPLDDATDDTQSNMGDFGDDSFSGATFTDDVIPGVYDYGVRLATTGV